ncbi:MAG: hypothetical protein QXR45_12680 [Candidatus Bathyarchaeia archaeon]
MLTRGACGYALVDKFGFANDFSGIGMFVGRLCESGCIVMESIGHL